MRRILFAMAMSICAAACAANASNSEDERFPVPSSYPPGTMEYTHFTAGVPEAWRLNALRTPERPDAAWKIVIITGTPSWSQYWAPTIAQAPHNYEIIVADRPGFSKSEPRGAVRDISIQAQALSPMLDARPGQRVVLIGQSFGAPVATLMAARHPDQVQALVLVSAFFGERGPTARRLFGVGQIVRPFLPRDLHNSIVEVSAQAAQLPAVWTAFDSLQQPIVVVHGERDTFVTLDAARRLAERRNSPLIVAAHGDHFLNACCVPDLLAAVQQAITLADAQGSAPSPAEH